ncbi:MAG TPA: amidohydrolase family protein [Vicinamibacterales bacterium]|nr:amidohydrolase family protein [Vicinamibacterales bacterium]
MTYRRLGLSMLAAVVLAAAGSRIAAQNPAADPCANARDVRLVNGRIATMDARNTIASELTIQNGRIVAVGKPAAGRLSACTREINLRGRTAIPGLVDNHNHIVLLGIRPGHDTRLETAASIADVQAMLKARAARVPAGEFITAMGGWNRAQFAEKRLPTLAELDAAAPNHPVLVYESFTGPAATNTRGRTFFTGKGVAVSDTGAIAGNAPSLAALNALRAAQTFEDQKRGTLEAMAYSASVGVTTNVDMGAFIPPGAPDVKDAFTADTLATADPHRMYDAMSALQRENKLTVRVRVFFLTMDTSPEFPNLKQRLLNTFRGFGDDMMRLSGVGEFATGWPLFGQPAPTNYTQALEFIARQGWPFQQHSLSPAEDKLTIDSFEAVNKTIPIAPLHWSIAHAPRIDAPTIARFKAIGAGIAIHPFTYLAGAPGSGPPIRTILESGVRAGAGSDAAQISTLNPWPLIYFMVTGKNAAGQLINDGQQITRLQALRLYTSDNSWFLNEEQSFGSLEPGRFGDVVVLSEDYFDTAKVPDEAIRRLRSVLTVVGGKVVHEDMK